MRTIPLPSRTLSELQPPGPATTDAPVRSIAIVGGVIENGTLGHADTYHLAKIFQICAENAIPIAAPEDLELGVVNLIYGDDFLKDPPRADMIIFSNIFYEPSCVDTSDTGMYGGFTSQSPDAGSPGAWHDALVKSGAKMAFNVYHGRGDDELPTRLLAKPPFDRIEKFDDRTKPQEVFYTSFVLVR
jgi:hypothetical protein